VAAVCAKRIEHGRLRFLHFRYLKLQVELDAKKLIESVIPSEARNLSFFSFVSPNRREIPRFARNDRMWELPQYSKPVLDNMLNADPRPDFIGTRVAYWPPAGRRLSGKSFAGAAVPVPVSGKRPARVFGRWNSISIRTRTEASSSYFDFKTCACLRAGVGLS
jgi:hypothetical protein